MTNTQEEQKQNKVTTDFYFYEDYAATIKQLSDEEAGEFIKLLGGYTLDGKQCTTTKTKPQRLFLLQSLTIKQSQQADSKRKYFTFYRQYYDVLCSLENEIAGGLIKKVCAYMFDKEFQTEDKNDETDAYFEVMKFTLDKSKIKAANASNRKITIETILEDFPQIQGNLRMDNQVLKDVNMKKLYKYIEEHPETQTDKIYNIVVNFRRDNGLPEVQK